MKMLIAKFYLRRLPHTKTTGFSFKEWHHGYVGLFMMLVGFIQIFDLSLEWNWWLMGLGFWVFIDDAIQHLIQRRQMKFFNFYDVVTIWNWLPGKIFLAKKYEKY